MTLDEALGHVIAGEIARMPEDERTEWLAAVHAADKIRVEPAAPTLPPEFAAVCIGDTGLELIVDLQELAAMADSIPQ